MPKVSLDSTDCVMASHFWSNKETQHVEFVVLPEYKKKKENRKWLSPKRGDLTSYCGRYRSSSLSESLWSLVY
ncbi:unnamed protein product [Leptosia nina]|uniref:Uncharacterized protein n=1 Tax=Leptosia nina TaxID=320188 RepID=A0AAV1IXT5_9NEOP